MVMCKNFKVDKCTYKCEEAPQDQQQCGIELEVTQLE
jgi:hypothetical protein